MVFVTALKGRWGQAGQGAELAAVMKIAPGEEFHDEQPGRVLAEPLELQEEPKAPCGLAHLEHGRFLGVTDECPELVRAVVVGDSPIDADELVAWMTSEGFKYWFSALRELAGLGLPVAELSRRIADIPVQAPGQAARIRYGDKPGVDAIQIQQLAITLSHMDPGVLQYHAEGHAREFLEGFDLDQILAPITCPVLLLQGNPSLGGMMTDEVVQHVQSVLPTTVHVFIEAAGHGPGMDTWEVTPLIRAVTSFLESL